MIMHSNIVANLRMGTICDDSDLEILVGGLWPKHAMVAIAMNEGSLVPVGNQSQLRPTLVTSPASY
jgi:hypothetical protein